MRNRNKTSSKKKKKVRKSIEVLKTKPYRFVSTYTSRVPQKNYGTKMGEIGNYHFWNVDDEGNIVDITPSDLGHNPVRIVDKPVYFAWSEEDTQMIINRMMTEYDDIEGGEGLGAEMLNEYSQYQYENPEFRGCFRNSWGCREVKGYKMVCGSMGYVIGEEKDFYVVDLDYGY